MHIQIPVFHNTTLKKNFMEKPYVIGMDMGGTNTVFELSMHAEMLSRKVLLKPVHTDVNLYIPGIYMMKMIKLDWCSRRADKFKGIGIGAPNGNYYTGNIEFAPNLPWKGVIPLLNLCRTIWHPCGTYQRCQRSCFWWNDLRSCTWHENFIMITLGTGVGSGIIIDGKVLYGHDGFAGNLDTHRHPRKWQVMWFAANMAVWNLLFGWCCPLCSRNSGFDYQG